MARAELLLSVKIVPIMKKRTVRGISRYAKTLSPMGRLNLTATIAVVTDGISMLSVLSIFLAFVGGGMVSSLVDKAHPERSRSDNLLHAMLIVLIFFIAYTINSW
jgi:zinc transporter ZupT